MTQYLFISTMKSILYKILGVTFYYKNYLKKAFVVIFNHTENHNSTAFEFFYKFWT